MLLLSVMLLGASPAWQATSPQSASASVQQPAASDWPAAVARALVGQWSGILEYRDYSEPATSTRRVQLPTWLTVTPATEGLRLQYVYDDGPSKLVKSSSTLVLNHPSGTFRFVGTDGLGETYRVAGLEALKQGRGTLELNGPGTEIGKPVEIRTTWTISRNLLTWLEEVRPALSREEFVFRHRYTFTRASPPSAPGKP